MTTAQTRRASLAEAVANVAIGYAIAVLAQVLVFPLFGMRPSLSQNLTIGLIFTIISSAAQAQRDARVSASLARS